MRDEQTVLEQVRFTCIRSNFRDTMCRVVKLDAEHLVIRIRRKLNPHPRVYSPALCFCTTTTSNEIVMCLYLSTLHKT